MDAARIAEIRRLLAEEHAGTRLAAAVEELIAEVEPRNPNALLITGPPAEMWLSVAPGVSYHDSVDFTIWAGEASGGFSVSGTAEPMRRAHTRHTSAPEEDEPSE